jgi:multiple sugar transport system ATP-binding protein
MRSEIKDLHRRLGTTIIYVTHDQIEAMTMAGKIVVMRSGNIEQIGTPLAVYDRPQTRFVAEFIGSPAMNFIGGILTPSGLRTSDNYLIPVACMDIPRGETQVVSGVRPEHLLLSENGVPAKVLVVKPTGSETQVVLQIGGHQLIGAFRERLAVGYGDTLHVLPNPEKIHLFDLQGKRLN